jgi:hypothetical protein
MFERFTLPARRALFWARAEAMRLGSDWIEPEHLLLGVLAEDQGDSMQSIPLWASQRISLPSVPAQAPFFTAKSAPRLRQLLTASAGTSKPDAVDMPLAQRSHRVLAVAAERDEPTITLLHLLRGLMNDSAVATVLASVGVTTAQIDEAIRKG